MKRCPRCASSFPDTVHFCEFDGARLGADYLDSNPDLAAPHEKPNPQTGTSAVEHQLDADDLDNNPDLSVAPEEQILQTEPTADDYQLPTYARAAPPPRNSQIISLIVLAAVVAAVGIGLVLFIVYQRMTYKTAEDNSNSSSNAPVSQQVPLLPSPPSPSVSESPSPEPSPSPSAMPSPAAQAQSARAGLSSSLVSTGGNEKTKRGPITIRLTNGNSFEADEVWETREGIWYRHRGVVTLLERDQVQAIEKPSPVQAIEKPSPVQAIEKPSPAASSASATPATSPSPTP